MKNQQVISREILQKGISYADYLRLIDDLLLDGKTTGPNQSEDLTHYAVLNRARMKRLDKTFEMDPDLRKLLQNLDKKWFWVVLTEGWCGDAAQNVPILAALAAAHPGIDFRILLRDEHPEVMAAYLTNGGKAIPKLIVLEADTLAEVGVWGPRPAPAQEMVMAFKANPTEPYSEFVKKVQAWYNHDGNATIQQEFKALLESWSQA
ncbi:MAG: thioredoxin family protein [Bacteroidia bacterium]|nr:thioredoxin family protein [Bacteroidia bacterium]